MTKKFISEVFGSGIIKKFYEAVNIDELPSEAKGTIIYGSLNLIGCNVKELPDNLVVLGDLAIEGTLLRQFPENLVVVGDLSYNPENFEYLPDTLKVGGGFYEVPGRRWIDDDGHLRETGITSWYKTTRPPVRKKTLDCDLSKK